MPGLQRYDLFPERLALAYDWTCKATVHMIYQKKIHVDEDFSNVRAVPAQGR